MPKTAYAESLKRARSELQRLRKQRAVIEARIAKLEQVEAALRVVTGGASKAPAQPADLSSITNVVRNVLKSARVPITPPEVRDKMVELGFDDDAYSQFLASIHVILKRLWKNGEALEFTFKDGKRYWSSMNSMPAGPFPENAMLGNYYNSYRAEDLKSPLTYEEAKEKEAAKYRR